MKRLKKEQKIEFLGYNWKFFKKLPFFWDFFTLNPYSIDMNYFYYEYNNSSVCKVKEDEKEYLPTSSTKKFLNNLCLEHGSNLQGRKEAFMYQMNIKKFVPIVVSLHPVEIYIPTMSLESSECRWINYSKIDKVIYEKKKCTIYFKDHTLLECENPERIKKTIKTIFRYLQMNS